MTTDPNIPGDWIPLSDIEATSTNADGGVFLHAPSHGTVMVIQYHEDGENDVISMYNTEAVHLVKRLLDHFHDEFDQYAK